MSNRENSEGGCFCGNIRYRLAAAPAGSMICHCNTCRRLFSAPVVGWLSVSADSFSFIAGEPSVFSTSAPVTRWFCSKCGTHLAYVHAEDPSFIEVATASLDNPSLFPPTHHSWLSQSINWAQYDDGLPKFQRSRYE